VTYAIMPVFALSNAGVTVGGQLVQDVLDPVSVGIILGLVVGKQVGITLASWLATRLGLAVLPEGVRWAQLYGVSWLGGIGFTMSLFIANLAFAGSPLIETAKVGILTGSLVAGVGGYALLAYGLPRIEKRADAVEEGV
jgi:NhaA family Na+:H+ antiporter